MRRYILQILAVSAMLVSLVSCGRQESRKIPRGKMAKIYAEMFVTDEWLSRNTDIRRMADTSLVYEPILEKYGYTSVDYEYSVNLYLDDPERFSRILRTTSEILGDEIVRLKKEKLRMKEEAEAAEIKTDFKPEYFFPYLFTEPYVHYYDSLVVEVDSLTATYMFKDVQTSDTTYDWVEMIIRVDTTRVDTLKVDSLAVKDSVAAIDTVAKEAVAKQDTVVTKKDVEARRDRSSLRRNHRRIQDTK